MKRFLFLIVIIVVAGFFAFNFAKQKVRNDLESPIAYPTTTITPPQPTNVPATGPEQLSLFVPYWTVKEKTTDRMTYDSYIYFGVEPNQAGINMQESGALSLNKFLAFAPQGEKKLLAVRMIDQDTDFAILKDPAKQQKVIADSIALAKAKNFDGIVLDLEVSAIPFDSLVAQINDFTKLFYQQVKGSNLSFSILVYGDVFYRLRPFDMKTLAKNTDNIMIMAYDFSKAKGNPGPNFPLKGEETYGYDYSKMIDDFLRVIPPKKLTVVFGLFGYDWAVDDKGESLSQGNAVTTQTVEDQFIESCSQRSCSFSRDPKSFETEVNYVAKDGSKHIIWFEDLDSVAAKKAYLKSRGINSFSYWAHSYF